MINAAYTYVDENDLRDQPRDHNSTGDHFTIWRRKWGWKGARERQGHAPLIGKRPFHSKDLCQRSEISQGLFSQEI